MTSFCFPRRLVVNSVNTEAIEPHLYQSPGAELSRKHNSHIE